MRSGEFINKRVLVVGLGITGLSVVRYLNREKLCFEVADESVDPATLVDVNTDTLIHCEFSKQLFCTVDVIILSPGIPRAHPAIVAALDAGVQVIGDIELFADAVQVPVIAVTGSNGKSTVVAWLAQTLNTCGLRAKACGNIGDPALDCLQSDVDVLVLELSSYQLESTQSLKPLSATVLNVSDDHLDRYDDIEHYAAIKRRVFNNARHCIVNLDDRRTWPDNIDQKQCTFFSLNNTAGNDACWQPQHLKDVELTMPGEHNVANALALLALAAPLAVSTAISENRLLSALQSFNGLPHRSEFIAEHNGVRWYNDSKGTNVDACAKAVMAMPGSVILIAGGISKGARFSALRDVLGARVKLLVLLGQDKHLIASQLQGAADIMMVSSIIEAVSVANEHAVSGDVVLLSPACASFDMFRNFVDRGEQFAEAVREVLAA